MDKSTSKDLQLDIQMVSQPVEIVCPSPTRAFDPFLLLPSGQKPFFFNFAEEESKPIFTLPSSPKGFKFFSVSNADTEEETVFFNPNKSSKEFS